MSAEEEKKAHQWPGIDPSLHPLISPGSQSGICPGLPPLIPGTMYVVVKKAPTTRDQDIINIRASRSRQDQADWVYQRKITTELNKLAGSLFIILKLFKFASTSMEQQHFFSKRYLSIFFSHFAAFPNILNKKTPKYWLHKIKKQNKTI